MKRHILFIALALGLVNGNCQPSTAVVSLGQYARSLDGTNYVVGIPTDYIVQLAAPESAGRQRKENWCWAACVQMGLNFGGIDMTQERIVRKVFGNNDDQPGNRANMHKALNGQYTNNRQQCVYVLSATLRLLKDAHANTSVRPWTTGETIIGELSHGIPIIVALSNPGSNIGHACLLTGADFYLDARGEAQVTSVILRDPWPSSASRQVMNFAEFRRRLDLSSSMILRSAPCRGGTITVPKPGTGW